MIPTTFMNVFVTGFPGFIGKRLALNLVKKKPSLKLTLLVHPAMEFQAKKDFKEMGFEGGQHRIVLGDITKPHLGLGGEKAQIQEQTEIVFHLAAIYDLTVSEDRAKEVNVFGTQNILDFFSKTSKLVRFNYVSTCYVAGKVKGLVTQEMLSRNQEFHNFYESTKYGAEVLVQKRMDGLPITIFRPSIVVGDSHTGETDKFDGPYVVMKFLHKIKLLLRLVPNLGFSDSEANTVPVDYVVDVMTYLGFLEKAKGQVYQICDQNPPLTEEFFGELVFLIGGVAPYHSSFLRTIILKLLRLPFISYITGITKQHLDYFMHQGKFRSANLLKDLEGSGIHLPHYKKYYPILYKYMKERV